MDNLGWYFHVEALLNTLGSMDLGENVNLVREYPSRIKDNPLSKITVSYGIKELNAFYDDDYPDNLILDATLDFTIHAPLASSGEECQSLFLQITEYIYQQMPTLRNFGCGEVCFNRSTSTLELEGYGVVRILL